MQDSHTHVSADDIAGDPSPLRLVSAGTAGLPEWLAGRVDEHLAVFAAHMTQGLLAADAVGSHAGVRMLGGGDGLAAACRFAAGRGDETPPVG